MAKCLCKYGTVLNYILSFFFISDDPNKPPNTDEPVNENEQFCCVFHTNLKGNNLLYGAEMDGIESDRLINFETDDLNSVKFVELKTKVRDDRENQKRNFLRFKTLNWWCQSFLVKIFKIVIGIRNRSGLVEQIQEIPIRDIPKMAQVRLLQKKRKRNPIYDDLLFTLKYALSELLVTIGCYAIL